MITVVLLFNLTIALICLYIAWRIWQLRLALATATDALTAAERRTHAVLHHAPDTIIQGQTGLYQLQQQYRQLMRYIQTIERLLLLLGVGQAIWQYTRASSRASDRLSSHSLPQRRSRKPRSPGVA